MDFVRLLPEVVAAFDEARIRYALIGGLAMAMHGVQRATLDADFILLADDLGPLDAILRGLGYRREFHSENASHYVGTEAPLGRLDFLHAFRPATLGMLERATRMPLTDGCSIPVVHLEDLVGLKVQASVNDPTRRLGDWSDIHRIIGHAARSDQELDWELLGEYLELFDLTHRLPELLEIHAQNLSSGA